MAANPQPLKLSIPTLDTVAAMAEAEEIYAKAQAQEITTARDALALQSFRKDLNGSIKALDDQRKSITVKLDDAKKAIMDLFRAPLERRRDALQLCDERILKWDEDQRRIAREAQRKLDDAAEKERIRLQKLADAAAERGDDKKAEAFLDRQEMVVAPIVQAEAPRAAGTAIASTWTFEVLDITKMKDEFKTEDRIKIGKVVRSLHADAEAVIGKGSVRVYEIKSVRS